MRNIENLITVASKLQKPARCWLYSFTFDKYGKSHKAAGDVNSNFTYLRIIDWSLGQKEKNVEMIW